MRFEYVINAVSETDGTSHYEVEGTMNGMRFATQAYDETEDEGLLGLIFVPFNQEWVPWVVYQRMVADCSTLEQFGGLALRANAELAEAIRYYIAQQGKNVDASNNPA